MGADQVVHWLLTECGPSIRYRTLTELLAHSDDDTVVREARGDVLASREVQRLLRRMHPDGYWLRRDGSGRLLGDGIEYTGMATTHFCLSYLAELGVDRAHPSVSLAVDRYLDLQQPDGDYWLHLSCLLGYNIRTFIRLGYGDDPRVRRSIDLMLGSDRPDGGYLCDLHEGRRVRRPEKSCLRGSGKALLAFAELPHLHHTSRCAALVEYFMQRGGVFRSGSGAIPVVPEAVRTSFPFTWACGLVEILLALSVLGHGRRPELDRAWQLLAGKRDAEGRYVLEITAAGAPWRVGRVGQANPWVTLYALLALHHRERTAA